MMALAGGPVLPPVDQAYLLAARQMQALSFAVHIPLVCFGIAFPMILLFTEWRYLRTGDELYRTLARRWTKVLVTLFAIGVVTGTILSFEMGLLWPAFTATFGGVFGLGFAIEGFSFFLEAIFIGIYVYGWDRLSPKAHFASGFPIAFAGFTGSLSVISVNAWMNHPSGFTLREGQVVDAQPFRALFGNSYFWHELVHMYLAGYMCTGFLLAGAYAVSRLRGHWGRYERTALAIPLTVAALAAPLHLLGWYTDKQIRYGIPLPKMLALLTFHSLNATVQGLDAVPPDQRPPVYVVRIAFQTMVGSGLLLALLAVIFVVVRVRHQRLPRSEWFYRALAVAGPLSVLALICGWVTTEVGRQPWVVYRVMRTSQAVTGANGVPIGYATLALVYLGLAVAAVWVLRRLVAVPLRLPADSPPPALSARR